MSKLRTLSLVIFSVCALLLISWSTSVGQQAADPGQELRTDDNGQLDPDSEAETDRADSFMREKLTASSEVLEGLMTEDLVMVADSAEKLLTMSKAERWRTSSDMMYLQHSTQFQTAVDDLVAKARNESIDGASLAWVNVTMSCIKCHEWVRNVVVADHGEGTPVY